MGGLNQHPISLSSNRSSGPHVLTIIPDPLEARSSDEGEELLIQASGITAIDAYTGLAVRASIDQHLLGDQAATVTPWLPKDKVAYCRLRELLGTLPQRCPLPHDHGKAGVDRRVLLPATSIEDREGAGLAAETLYKATADKDRGRLRLGTSEAYFLGEAAAVLLDNALTHSANSASAPYIACTMEPGSRNVQLSVLDLGTGVSHCDDPVGHLRDCTAADRQGLNRGFRGLIDMAEHRGIKIAIEIRSGTGFSRWSSGWSTRSVSFSPGWATGISVQID
jgi:hypothetical protein